MNLRQLIMRILLEPSSVQMLYIRLPTLPLLAAAPLNNNRTSNWRQYRPDVFIVLPPSIHLPPVYEVVVMYWQLTWPCYHPSLFTVTHIGFVRILGPGDNFIPLSIWQRRSWTNIYFIYLWNCQINRPMLLEQTLSDNAGQFKLRCIWLDYNNPVYGWCSVYPPFFWNNRRIQFIIHLNSDAWQLHASIMWQTPLSMYICPDR